MVQVVVPKFANEGNLYYINNINKESRVKVMNYTNCIYLITNKLNQKQYIGVAKDFTQRMYQHSIGHDAEHSYIDRSILQHGWENYEVVIVDNYSTEKDRKELEQKYIKQYHTHRSEGGYNLTWGGDDTCFPDVRGQNNPRAQLTEEDVRNIRERRMNGERMSTVYEDYKDKLQGNKRAGFSKIWLHESWLNICSEYKGHYPQIDNKYFAAITKNELNQYDIDYLNDYFKWFGPINKYNEIYKIFKGRIDWESFQKLCGEIIEKLYGNKSTRRYRNKNGETQKRIDMFRAELGEEPKY